MKENVFTYLFRHLIYRFFMAYDYSIELNNRISKINSNKGLSEWYKNPIKILIGQSSC